jgi:ethanolamine transporter EutH
VGVSTPPSDPVLERRAQIARLSQLGKRVGYLLFAYAVVAFVVGYQIGFRAWLVDTIVAAMVVGSILLVPAIVFAYGVKAADREDAASLRDAGRASDRAAGEPAGGQADSRPSPR